MANNNSHQGELFELTQSDAIKRAAFEASNRSYKSLQEVLNSYSLIEDNMKSNFIVCRNYVTKNGLILSIAPEEVRDNLPLALIAISNNKKSYEYVSENLQKNKDLIEALVKQDPFYAFLKIPDSCLKKKEISSFLFNEILKLKITGNTTNTKPILKRIFSKDLKDSLINQSACYQLISRFISSNGENFRELSNAFQKDESLIIKAISAGRRPYKNITWQLPNDFVVSDSLYFKMTQAGLDFKLLPFRLKNIAKFCEASLRYDISYSSLFKEELWKNKDLSISYLKIPDKRTWQKQFHEIAKIIEKFHKSDEEVIYWLVENSYIIEDDSKFLDNKEIVETLLKNLAERHCSVEVLKKFKKISPRLKKDKDITSLILKMDFQRIYPEIDNSLKLDIPLMKSVLYGKSSCFEDFPKVLKDNKDIAKTAIRRSGKCYLNVSERLKNDIEIINLTLDKKPSLFKHFPKKIREDIKVVSKAVKEDSTQIAHVSSEIRSNKSFMKKAIMYGACLKYASSELKKDKDIVKLAVSQHDSNLFHAHSEIKKNKKFLLANFPIYLVFIYCSKTILQDNQIFIKGLNLDWRLIERRKMSSDEILKMNYEGVDYSKRLAIFNSFKKKNNLKDIFLIANAKSIICGT
tara:strand:+ start:374 stop:2275 length:1902 start_codon:yes stop_codon:yes gene_type:complete